MTSKIFLKAKEEKEIKQGFPWVFDNEIEIVKREWLTETGAHQSSLEKLENTKLEDGSVVEVLSKSGLYLGTGIFNKKSKITVRIMSKNRGENFDYDFFKNRIEQALAVRFPYYTKQDSYRLVFDEADFLPGLTVERYCDTEGRVFLCVQFLALCTEKYREEIIEALKEVCHPFGIYERSDASVREKEGLEEKTGWIGAEHNPVITIKENGVLLTVDLEKGQKTGYFLDQKFNRKDVSTFAKGKTVLDTFTHTGAFALNCALAGAKEVTAVDISPEAVETVNNNIKLNNQQKTVTAVCADVFDLLRQYEEEKKSFDMIILDPPAFTKSAKMVQKAYGGYKEINLRALKILKPGGILVTCSCSHFFDTNTFYSMIQNAAEDAHKTIQILEKRGAGPDHPVLVGYPKSEYLKCAILRVL